jgi:hypothetical protein
VFLFKNSLSFIFPFLAACEKPNILCKSKGHNVCVLADFICDDSFECEDGEDEKHCVHEGTDKECYGNQFACGSIGSNHKECIEGANVCDGKEDCPDGSDEMTEDCGTNKLIIIIKIFVTQKLYICHKILHTFLYNSFKYIPLPFCCRGITGQWCQAWRWRIRHHFRHYSSVNDDDNVINQKNQFS